MYMIDLLSISTFAIENLRIEPGEAVEAAGAVRLAVIDCPPSYPWLFCI
jgi:hypothetical protein